MKNLRAVIKLSIFIGMLILSSCSGSKFYLSDGEYVSTTSSLTYIRLDLQEHEFEFVYNPVLSYVPRGSFEVDNERLVATYTWHGGEEVYVFRIIDVETLEFVKDESSDISLEDGEVFKVAK